MDSIPKSKPVIATDPAFSEVAAAIVSAANAVKAISAHATLRAAFAAAIACAQDVERLAQDLRNSTASGLNNLESIRRNASADIPIIPQITAMTSEAAEPRRLAAESCLFKEDSFALRNGASSLSKETIVANHILELHDRMGGFIKH
jgi:ABC-type transporter Mla subunit MlaD